jgi:hypothetical protein
MNKLRMNILNIEGSLLDYAVDRSINRERYGLNASLNRVINDHFHPSTSWALCGGLMEVLSISCYCIIDEINGMAIKWVAVNEQTKKERRIHCVANDPRTAICRAIASVKEDEIDIPRKLIKNIVHNNFK